MATEWPGSLRPADRWEYKMEHIDLATVDVEIRCNALGAVGWELVTATPYQAAGTAGIPATGLRTAALLLIFKRQMASG
jgi:hypothetical protein